MGSEASSFEIGLALNTTWADDDWCSQPGKRSVRGLQTTRRPRGAVYINTKLSPPREETITRDKLALDAYLSTLSAFTRKRTAITWQRGRSLCFGQDRQEGWW